jgi:hypothetical protein
VPCRWVVRPFAAPRYESADTDVITPTSMYYFYDERHSDSFNMVSGYWSVDGPHRYGYWGKSYGDQANSQPLTDGLKVYDIGAHPPTDKHKYAVLRFEVPKAGSYSVDLFGAQRKETVGVLVGIPDVLCVVRGPCACFQQHLIRLPSGTRGVRSART